MGDIPPNPAGNFQEEPLKQSSAVDTPPVAVTPADDGSDFYNTPWTANTPVNNDENRMNATPANAADSTTSTQPAAQIPGLNLVNHSLSNPQPANAESIKYENTGGQNDDGNSNAAIQSPATHNETEPASATGEAMEVEDAERRLREAANTDSNMTDSMPAAQSSETNEAGEANEQREWETDSSPYESSSDDSTTDSEDDSDDEDYPILSPEEQARILMQAEDGSDDEGAKGKAAGHIKTANEIVEDVPPIPDIKITPDMKIVHLGNVQVAVENAVLIEANTSGEYQVLESGSVLCTEDRQLVGVVSETLGRVESPLYALRYSTAAEVEERGLVKGKPIYYVESHSTFVFTQPLKGMKGSDASNFHDEEIAEDEVEFSDDEAEAEHKRKLKQQRQERKNARSGPGSARTRREPPGPSKLSQGELNYDDDGYTPLARPQNLHEMMGHQEAPVETESLPRGAFRGGRARGRGDRGRGGRGRGGRSGEHLDHHTYHQETPSTSSLPEQPNYNQPSYQQSPQNAYGMPQQFAQFAPFLQQQPYGQGSTPLQFPFQMPAQQAYQQPNPYQQMPPNVHINPLFLAALQQQQQQQQPQGGAPQAQNQTMNFDQVRAQLDILRQLSPGNQGPRPT